MMRIPIFHLCPPKHFIRTLGIFAAVAFMSPSAFSKDLSCGPLRSSGQYGPYDYRSDRDKLSIVEGAHFTPEVEALIRGHGGYLGGDFDYTLRAFPNHHRALIAMMNLGKKFNTDPPPHARYTVECWFDRALRFSPDDPVARLIYVQYLVRSNRVEEAMTQLELTETHAGDNPMTLYNIGLSYFELKAYDKALLFARKSLELGIPRTDLRDSLAAIGKWVEPMSAAPLNPAASAPQ